jgi:hypothetical protein
MTKTKIKKLKAPKTYTEDLSEFESFSGMLNEATLEKLKLKKLIGLSKDYYDNDDGGIEANSESLKALLDFVEKNPAYHIVSMTEGDEGEACYSNQVRIVNRMKYYVANGSKADMECVDADTIRDEDEA